jgi:hypothetical protein
MVSLVQEDGEASGDEDENEGRDSIELRCEYIVSLGRYANNMVRSSRK